MRLVSAMLQPPKSGIPKMSQNGLPSGTKHCSANSQWHRECCTYFNYFQRPGEEQWVKKVSAEKILGDCIKKYLVQQRFSCNFCSTL